MIPSLPSTPKELPAVTLDSDNSDTCERLDLRAKDYALKIRERRQRRHQQRIAEELRDAISSVEAATSHFQEFLESGGGDEDSSLTRMYLDDARRELENALGGIEETP